MIKIHPILLYLLTLAIPASTFGQHTNELVNSGELLQQGQQLHDDGRYKEAIALYKKIPRSDTNYADALQELALSCYNDSAFEESKNYATLGLNLFPERRNSWYSYLANAADELGKDDEAIAYYQKILQANPNDYTAMFNMGVTYYNQDKYDEAETWLKKTLLVYPFYTSAHYFLGIIELDRSHLPQALMSFSTVFLINPEYRRSSTIVKYLTDIANVKDYTIEKSGTGDQTFAVQQEIMETKAALDKKYRLTTDVEDPITRQLQALLEKLEYDDKSTDFWMQFYVPFFRDVYAQKQYDLMVNYMFSGLQIKSVEQFTKKNKKDIDDFIQFTADYFNTIKETQTLNASARKDVKQRFLFSNGQVSGKGKWNLNDKGEQVLTGPWEFYYTNGAAKSKGLLDEKQQKQGEWVFYYANGHMKEKTTYKDDAAQGKSIQWWDNGLLYCEEMYKDGMLNGECRYYYYNGILRRVLGYKDDKREGPAKGYTMHGFPDFTATFRNDKEEGEVKYYHKNGNVRTLSTFSAGVANGAFKKYNPNGTLIEEGSYINDKLSGVYKKYYANSAIKSESMYAEGDLQGEYKEYFENGKLSYTVPYTKGKADGKEQDFGEDGVLASETVYERGRVREVKFYDKTGKVISSASTRNGAGNFAYYDEFGNKYSEGPFTKEGWRNGVSSFYYRNGALKAKANYKEGLLDGEKNIYYRDGKVSETINYVDDSEDGYYTSFFMNNRMKTEGWYKAGDQQGNFTYYDLTGNVNSQVNYLNGEQDGYSTYFYPNGKKDYEELYDETWIKHITQWDSTGKVLLDIDIPDGNGDFVFKHHNGKPYIKGSYKNFLLQGKYETLFFDGSPNIVRFYNKGLADSVFREYFYGGKISTEGHYTLGEASGTWKYYYENGQKKGEDTYVDGELEGKSKIYNEDGTLDKELNYHNGELEGFYTMYGEKQQPALRLKYHNGDIISYSYQDKDGKWLPETELKNGTGMITAYYKNGKKSAEINYEDGEVNGVRKLYFTNGNTYLDGSRLWGYEQGSKKVYTFEGKVISDENYYYGNEQGLIKYYYPSGKIKAEENWYYGKLHGPARYFDESGKLTQTRIYYYGILQTVN